MDLAILLLRRSFRRRNKRGLPPAGAGMDCEATSRKLGFDPEEIIR
jgi:hypothetical protein